MKKSFEKQWDHKASENKLYENWERSGYFKPEINPNGEPFCIIMPPPNANGSLHVGHALFVALEDIMTRYARLTGKAALWLPGADHAGFETQVVFEKKLEKEGKSRFQFSRDELYKMMWEFTQSNKSHMEDQLRSLGASCDWSREKFTLDEDIKKTVYQTFKALYDDGLAYRAKRLVNWCPKHQTSLSDLELEHIERDDFLYEIDYGLLTVATTRPETMFGDSAVAVHPSDKRYKSLVGQELSLPLTNRKIQIIGDEAIDIKYGSGAVKITPAHDPLDFEIGERHKLDFIQVINERGKMEINPQAGILPQIAEKIAGKKTAEAREIVAQELKNIGVLKNVKKYHHSVGTCYKCGSIIEPMPKEQWYIAVTKDGRSGKNLARDALSAVKEKKIKFVTKRFENIFINWLENIRDWNISRQIVWGIQIPAWYKGGEIIIGDESPGEGWVRDTDVFDTWFSSGQWPFATLQNSKNAADFEKFYPSAVMETAYDIIFFWVARMAMLGQYVTGDVPFQNVYIHGIVRDKDNQKMSKSRGNVVDPIEIVENHGADALRLALVFGTSPGADSSISDDKIRGMRNFSNKIWNASRFVALRVSDGDLQTGEIGESRIENLEYSDELLTEADKTIIKAHKSIKSKVKKYLDEFKFSMAGETLYEYFWHEFCDSYIELSKSQLDQFAQLDKLDQSKNTKKILIKVLSETLIMLHPFVPYVTEAVWQELRQIYPNLSESIMVVGWPE